MLSIMDAKRPIGNSPILVPRQNPVRRAGDLGSARRLAMLSIWAARNYCGFADGYFHRFMEAGQDG